MGNKIIVEFDKDKYKGNICSKCNKIKSCNQNTLRVFVCGYEKNQWYKVDYKE